MRLGDFVRLVKSDGKMSFSVNNVKANYEAMPDINHHFW